MASKRIISTLLAPKPIGPYSQAVLVDKTLYISGQIGLNPETSKMADGGIEEETKQALNNMGEILKAANSSFSNVVKTTVFLTDLSMFDRMNSAYSSYFSVQPPARSAFQVSKLPKNAQVEIEAIAIISATVDVNSQL